MAGIDMAHRLAIAAVVNGLRKGGEVSDVTVDAIAAELRAATSVSDDMGHGDTSAALNKLADDIQAGRNGK